jgi:hypothetical protein
VFNINVKLLKMKKLIYLFVMVAGMTLASVNVNAQDPKAPACDAKKGATAGCCAKATSTACGDKAAAACTGKKETATTESKAKTEPVAAKATDTKKK